MATYSDFVRDDYKRPIPGATAKLFSADGSEPIAMAKTGADGQFTLDAADGKYLLEVSYGGASDRSSVIIGNPPEYVGPAGPANSTFKALAGLKAAPVSNGTYSLLTSAGRTDYAYVPGDFSALINDVMFVKLDAVAATVGALVIAGPIQASAFGVSTTNADNGPAFGRMIAVARVLAVQYAIPPRIDLQSGVYRYSGLDAGGIALNWAVQGLTIAAQPGVVLAHTGTGVAFPCDGGATGGGIAMMKVTGGLVVRGNANTTDGLWNRAIHHSTFDMEIQSVAGAALRTNWVVCNEYWIRCSPLFRPPFTTLPNVGAFLTSRNTGEKTSRCTFYNPIFEGINGYGINLDDAIINTFLGGTSESNAGGIYIGANSSGNIIDGLDMEFNTTIDLFCFGAYNTFRNLLSDNTATVGGLLNKVEGGLWNELKSTGDHNEFSHINYGIAGGAFTDTGATTVYRMMRNAFGGAFLPDRLNQPTERQQYGSVGMGLLIGPANIIDGGSAADMAFARQNGGVTYLRSPAGRRFSWSDAGINFGDGALQLPRNLPAAATDLPSSIALLNVVAQYLIDVSLCKRTTP